MAAVLREKIERALLDTMRMKAAGRRDRGTSTLTVAFDVNGQLPADGTAFPEQTFSVGAEWQQLTVQFADLGLDSSAVSSIDFVVADAQAPFDLWVRDLALLCKTTCP
jgi:hypothetical protein